MEPERLPADFLEVRRKRYCRLSPSKDTGIEVPEELLGSKVVGTVCKYTFDSLIYTHLLCRNVYDSHELKVAKRSYHETRRYFASKKQVFGTSRFVRQTMKVISITLRLSEGYLRYRDRHTSAPIGADRQHPRRCPKGRLGRYPSG